MVKIIIKSYQVRGFIADFHGDESKKIKDYCQNNHNNIESLIGGPNEEDLIREILDDEYYDLYDNHVDMSEDFGPNSSSPIFDNDFEIFLSKEDKLSKINIDSINIKKSKINVKDWAEKNKNAIAYAFGCISDEIIEIEIEEIDVDEFDPSKLTLNIIENNEFFPTIGSYVLDIEYDDEWIDMNTSDIDGDYFNTTFVKT